MKAVVTGGAGFIGSHLVEALAGRGDVVTVLDDLSSGKEANLDGVGRSVRFVRGDVRDASALDAVFAGAEVVFHLAALPSVDLSVQDPERSHDINATGTLRVLDAARRARVRRVVFASSSAVYGDNPDQPCREDAAPRPLSPYAASKYAGELYARVYATAFGLETVSLRFFNVFGARQDPSSHYAAAVPRFIDALLDGRAPEVHGDGEQTRDFVHVRQVVEAMLLAVEAPAAASGNAYNIASGASITINDLVRTLARVTGSERSAERKAARPGDVRHSAASIDRARRDLGFDPPAAALEQGLKETVAWFEEARAWKGRQVR